MSTSPFSNTPASYVIKVTHKRDIRRFQLQSSASFTELDKKIAHVFSEASVVRITWEDDDGDAITVHTEADWLECTHSFTAAAGAGAKVVIRLAVQLEPEKASPHPTPPSPHVTFDVGAGDSAGADTTVPGSAADHTTAAATTTAAAATTVPETCHLTMIIDRSRSMSSLGDSVLSGIKTYLQELAAVDERDGSSTSVLFSTFDDKYQVKHNCLPIKEAQVAITAQDIEPRGMTALHDAIGYGLRDTRKAVKALGPGNKPGKVVVFILTDGQENSSKKWNSSSVRKEIAKLEAAPYNYAFFFAAAGQDALDTGASMGLGADDCITWTPDRRAASACFGAVAEATTSHRRGMSKAFTPVHRRSTCTDTTTSDGSGGGGFGGSGGARMRVHTAAPMTPRRRSSASTYQQQHHHVHPWDGAAGGFDSTGGAQNTFGAPAADPSVGGRGFSFGTAPAPAPAPAVRGRFGGPTSPATPAAPAQARPADCAFAANARSSALGKKWEKELAELDAMGLAVFRDGMPELLEQTNGSVAKALDLLFSRTV